MRSTLRLGETPSFKTFCLRTMTGKRPWWWWPEKMFVVVVVAGGLGRVLERVDVAFLLNK